MRRKKELINVKNDDVNNDLKSYKDNFFNIIFSNPPYNLGSRTYVDKDGKMKESAKGKAGTNNGKKFSKETKKRMSDSAKKAWENRNKK